MLDLKDNRMLDLKDNRMLDLKDNRMLDLKDNRMLDLKDSQQNHHQVMSRRLTDSSNLIIYTVIMKID
jgi:hypothetical protein